MTITASALMKSKEDNKKSILVLGLGNELLADDGIGILAVKRLSDELPHEIDVVGSSLSGVALMELFIGYQKAIVIDAIQTRRCPPGTIHELNPSDFDSVIAPSPHYSGLPEILVLARQLQLDFPNAIKVFAIEVDDAHTIGGNMSQPVAEAIPEVIERVKTQLNQWQREVSSTY
jgi:hydrogenase maturation protease